MRLIAVWRSLGCLGTQSESIQNGTVATASASMIELYAAVATSERNLTTQVGMPASEVLPTLQIALARASIMNNSSRPSLAQTQKQYLKRIGNSLPSAHTCEIAT